MSTSTGAVIEKADLKEAYRGSWYFIAGCGGPLEEWVSGYEDVLSQRGIGKPERWASATGAEVNAYAGENGDPFPPDLVCLLFPLDGLHVGRLALLKIMMGDRWFDDVVQNMRRRA